ncbi:MAG: phosphate-starvation-inducible PsiE family protein [Desulfobacterales bacterium]|nr:phosphate-starvation-inducible PsiE family protein [Desulfobacterales bacterium]
MEKFLHRFEHTIVIFLLVMMIIVVLLSTIELAVILTNEMIAPPFMLIGIDNMLAIFGFFMMILIGLELIETIKIYLSEEVIHVEIISLVAIIAITRKIIILDVKKMDPLMVLGISALVISLCTGYYLLKKGLYYNTKPKKND